jgi:hypothetical protein
MHIGSLLLVLISIFDYISNDYSKLQYKLMLDILILIGKNNVKDLEEGILIYIN